MCIIPLTSACVSTAPSLTKVLHSGHAFWLGPSGPSNRCTSVSRPTLGWSETPRWSEGGSTRTYHLGPWVFPSVTGTFPLNVVKSVGSWKELWNDVARIFVDISEDVFQDP